MDNKPDIGTIGTAIGVIATAIAGIGTYLKTRKDDKKDDEQVTIQGLKDLIKVLQDENTTIRIRNDELWKRQIELEDMITALRRRVSRIDGIEDNGNIGH